MSSSGGTIGISNVTQMFQSAAQEGEMGDEASQIMIANLNDTNILGCTGVGVDDLESDSNTLVSIVLDSSYSMKQHEDVVREAYGELLIDALKESKQCESMLVSARTFDTRQDILYGFKQVSDVGKIGSKYSAEGNSTALYDAVIDAIIGIRAYAKTLNDAGTQTKCIVVVFSDGGNNDGRNMVPDPVKKLVDDCIKDEMFFPVYVGFKMDPADDLDAIGRSMGFPNIMTSAKTKSDIRKAMGLVSQSVIRKSQTQIGGSNTFFDPTV